MNIAHLVKAVLYMLPAYRRWHFTKELAALNEDKAHLLAAAKPVLIYDAGAQAYVPSYPTCIQALITTYDAQIAKLSSALATTASKRLPQA